MESAAKDFQDTYPMAVDSRLPAQAAPTPPTAGASQALSARPAAMGLQFLRYLFTYRLG